MTSWEPGFDPRVSSLLNLCDFGGICNGHQHFLHKWNIWVPGTLFTALVCHRLVHLTIPYLSFHLPLTTEVFISTTELCEQVNVHVVKPAPPSLARCHSPSPYTQIILRDIHPFSLIPPSPFSHTHKQSSLWLCVEPTLTHQLMNASGGGGGEGGGAMMGQRVAMCQTSLLKLPKFVPTWWSLYHILPTLMPPKFLVS